MSSPVNNVDPNEIKQFSQLAEQWWQADGPMKPLHQLNPLRMQFITQQIDIQGKQIVDVGCGGGLLSEELAKQGASVIGIDQSEALIDVAQKHAEQQQLSIDYQFISAEQLSNQQAQQFDIVTCMELLEHVPDPAAFVKTCSQLVKPGGLVFFSTINRNIKSFLGAIVAAEYIFQWLPKGTHQFSQFIRPSELNQWAQQANLPLRAIQGIRYHPLDKRFTLDHDVQINYMTCHQKDLTC